MTRADGSTRSGDDAPDLRVEPVLASDGEALAAWLASDVWPFHGTARPTLEQTRAWVADGRFHGPDEATFWVHEPDADAGGPAVGLIALHELTDPTPIFDLRIRSDHRGRGLGRRAVRWLARWLFTTTDRTRVEAHVRADNAVMRRTMRACGWVQEAHHRQAWPDASGAMHDAVTYALLASDWRAGTRTPVKLED